MPSVVLWYVNELLIAPWLLFLHYFKILLLVLMLKTFIHEVKFPGWKFCLYYCGKLAPKGFVIQCICMTNVRWSYGFCNFDSLSNYCVVVVWVWFETWILKWCHARRYLSLAAFQWTAFQALMYISLFVAKYALLTIFCGIYDHVVFERSWAHVLYFLYFYCKRCLVTNIHVVWYM